MRALGWLAKGFLFLILFGFALKNTGPVELRFFLGHSWRAPLSLLLFVFFTAGTALGVGAALGVAYRQRKELERLKAQAAAPAASGSATVATGPRAP